jgi:hypothetical protein
MSRFRRISIVIIATLMTGLAWVQSKPSNRPMREMLSLPVSLNHFFFVLDAHTYDDVLASEFLKSEFAAAEQRTTVRRDKTYTGFYVYGEHTYFEFFNSAVDERRKLHDTGLAFAIEQEAGAKVVESALQQIGTIETRPTTRQLGDKDVPWFTSVSIDDFIEGSGVHTWLMEYDPGFLTHWHAELGGSQSISRSDVLKRYVAVLPFRPARPLLGDVRKLTIAVSPDAARSLAEMCERLGYRSSKEGEATILQGPGVILRFVRETAAKRGLQEVVFGLTRPAEKSTLRFGDRSILKLDGTEAIWTF